MESADSSAQPPAKASDVEPPAKASNVEPPTKSSNDESFTNAAKVEHPLKGPDVEYPAKAANVEPPVKATNAEPPAKATNAEPPAKSANVESSATATNVGSSAKAIDVVCCPSAASGRDNFACESPSMFSASDLSSWAKNLKLPQQDSLTGSAGMLTFARFTSGFGLSSPSKAPGTDETTEATSTTMEGGSLELFTKGLVDSSRSAVKAMQVKARHIASQNKRRYQAANLCYYC